MKKAAVALLIIAICFMFSSMASAQSNQTYKWTGFYVGLNAGYGFGGDNNWSHTPVGSEWYPVTAAGGVAEPSYDPKGFIGGIQLGADWRFSDVFVIGIESDIQKSNIGDSNTGNVRDVGFAPEQTRIKQDLKWFGSTRVRFGVLPTDRILVYGTAGLAYGKIKNSNSVSFSDGGELYTNSSHKTRSGYAVGGGLEFALAKNISLKGEYLYYDLGRSEVDYVTVRGYTPQYAHGTFTTRGNILRMGVNYRF